MLKPVPSLSTEHVTVITTNMRPPAYCCVFRGLVSSTRRIPKQRAESQQIAAWKLLYRVQHPARYVSRLQTIQSSDIELMIPMIDRQQAWSDMARIDPTADRWPHTANRARATIDANADRLVKSHCFEPIDSRNS